MATTFNPQNPWGNINQGAVSYTGVPAAPKPQAPGVQPATDGDPFADYVKAVTSAKPVLVAGQSPFAGANQAAVTQAKQTVANQEAAANPKANTSAKKPQDDLATQTNKMAQLIAQGAYANLKAQNQGIEGKVTGLQNSSAFTRALGAQNVSDINGFYNNAAAQTHQDVGQLAGADNQILRGLPTHTLPGSGAAGAASAAAMQQSLRSQSSNDVQRLVDTMAGARGDQANSQMNAANQATFTTNQNAQQIAALRGEQAQNSALAQEARTNPSQYYSQALAQALQTDNGQAGLDQQKVNLAQGYQNLAAGGQNEELNQAKMALAVLQNAGSLASASGNTQMLDQLAQMMVGMYPGLAGTGTTGAGTATTAAGTGMSAGSY